MEVKKTLYQVLQAPRNAASDIIKACYESRLGELGAAATPEANSQRAILREAFEILSDPARRRQYEEKLREEARRALSRSGEEEARVRPANARPSAAEASSPVIWIVAAVILVLAGVGGTVAYNDHKRKVEAQRVETEQRAEETRLRELEAKRKETDSQYRREVIDWAKDRVDSDRQDAAYRRQEYERERRRQQMRAEDDQARREQSYAEQRQLQQERQAEYERQRQDQENLRRSQMQLERERRQLQELERTRPRNF